MRHRKIRKDVAFQNKYISSRQRWSEWIYFLLLIQALWWLSYWALSFLEVIRTILYCKRNDPRILKSCLYTLLILLTSLYSIVAGAMLHPEPVPVYELIPDFQIGVYGFSFSFILLAVACLYRRTLPFVLLGYAMIYVIGVLIPLLRYVVSMMDYFIRTRV